MFRPLTTASLALALTACSPQFEEAFLVEPVIAESTAAADGQSKVIAPVPLPIPKPRPTPGARRGVITAGDIDDTLNLAAFQRYVTRTAKAQRLPSASFAAPIRAQLLSPPFWTGYSGINGHITVFPAIHGAGRPGTVEMRVATDNGQQLTQRLSTKGNRAQVWLPEARSWKPDFLDLAIVLDTTGSMRDEIDWITKEIKGIVATAKRAAPGVDIRYGLVSYKAPGDYPPVQSFGFTKNIGQMRGWLKSLNSYGGSGGDEVVARGLEAGVAMNWRRGKGERILIQIGDEPPSNARAKAYLKAAQTAARKGIHVYGLGASGVEEKLEYLLRSAAAQTQGRYLFLTDDSGVGLAHGEPDISCYRVTRLTNLMTRILQSELSGKRLEASPNQVIRTVGNYRNGVCQN